MSRIYRPRPARGDCIHSHHYDLLGRPGWEALSILVVTPYVERSFFVRLVTDLKPKSLSVVIDDGCRPEDVEMVHSLGRDRTSVEVALGGARGLVHAKIFHVVWRTSGGNRADTLVYGSGNATGAAFNGDVNAEMMCKARLTAKNHSALIQWANDVRDAVAAAGRGHRSQIKPHPEVKLAKGVVIRLPAMWVKPSNARADNLDLWLQRGHIVSEYRPDPGFLRVSVELLTDLPPGALERSVNELGFETAPRRRLTRPYVPIPANTGGNERWKAKYFAWTQLGAWCSASCRAERGHLFLKAGHQGRRQALEQLRLFEDPAVLAEAKARHLDSLESLWLALGRNAPTFLASSGSRLNRRHYGRQFNDLVEHHLVLASDREFCDRYITGCEVIGVPRFRDDAAAWQSFVSSLARQLHVESMKRRSQSLVFLRLRKALSDIAVDPFKDSRKLVVTLRAQWNAIHGIEGYGRTGIGEFVDNYHRDD